MKTFPKFVLLLGILMMVGGLVGAGALYMDMRKERHLHDRVAGIKFGLAEQTDWRSDTFSLYDTGYCTLHLATSDASGNQSDPDTMTGHTTLYRGTFEARILDPSNQNVWSKRIDGSAISLVPPPNTAWIFIDSVDVPHLIDGSWKLEVRVTEADAEFSRTLSELILMPPQALNIGFYIYGQSVKLIGAGLCIVIGFCTMILGGYLRRKSQLRTT